MKLPAHLTGFPGIARFLNYKRSLPTPISARVDIPNLPYEAFTPDGTKVKPWSLIRFFESVRAFVFWPIDYTENPDRSLAELHEIIKDYQFFNVGAGLDIERRFHDPESTKFPLYVDMALEHVGSSSKRVAFKLHNAITDELYATCCVDDVLMSVKTRQKEAYPDWWTAKYGPLCTGQKTELFKLDPHITHSMNQSYDTRFVHYSDMDPYGHTNWSSYVKFVFDSLHQNVQSGRYSSLNDSHLDSGMRAMQMAYKSEANCGDILKIKSWDTIDANAGPVLNCDVTNDGKSCFQSKTVFYS